jgi:hypothetical protein
MYDGLIPVGPILVSQRLSWNVRNQADGFPSWRCQQPVRYGVDTSLMWIVVGMLSQEVWMIVQRKNAA